jgi:hypothetical protein
MHHTCGSASARATASPSWVAVAVSTALRASGRFSVTRSTTVRSTVSTRTSGVASVDTAAPQWVRGRRPRRRSRVVSVTVRPTWVVTPAGSEASDNAAAACTSPGAVAAATRSPAGGPADHERLARATGAVVLDRPGLDDQVERSAGSDGQRVARVPDGRASPSAATTTGSGSPT